MRSATGLRAKLLEEARLWERKKIPWLDMQLALGQVALGLAREECAGHFLDKLGGQVTQP